MIAKETFKNLGRELNRATAVVQGFGKVGSEAAAELAKHGCKIIADGDPRGGTYNSIGLNTNRLIENKGEAGSLAEFKNGDRLTNDELLELTCDILIPCAVDGVITAANVPRLNARAIFTLGGPPYPRIGQVVATFLLGVSPLHTGASIIFLVPQASSSGDRAYQATIPLRVKVVRKRHRHLPKAARQRNLNRSRLLSLPQ